MTPDDILAWLEALPENEKQEIEADALQATAKRYFVPNMGPGEEGERDTSFAEGKRFVGMQIVKQLKLTTPER